MQHLLRIALVTLAPLAAVGCVAPEDQNLIFIRGAVALDPPDCESNPATSTFLANGLLDIGTGVTDANSYSSALIVESALLEDRVALDAAEVEFQTDVAQKLEGVATPGGGAKARRSFVGGLIDPGGKTGTFVTTVTDDDARSLQDEPLVTTAGLNPENPERQVRIIAKISIEGKTQKGIRVRTPPFFFPIDLCVGCLTRQLGAGDCPTGTTLSVNETCGVGQDIPINSCQ